MASGQLSSWDRSADLVIPLQMPVFSRFVKALYRSVTLHLLRVVEERQTYHVSMLQVTASTMLASAGAAFWRIFMQPIQNIKTLMQVLSPFIPRLMI